MCDNPKFVFKCFKCGKVRGSVTRLNFSDYDEL